MCGAHIKTGSSDVVIGGETVRVGFVLDLEIGDALGLGYRDLLQGLAGAARDDPGHQRA